MIDTKWTPGPWEVRKWEGEEWPENRFSVGSQVDHKPAVCISLRYGDHAQVINDFNLIAAAPDLYEALEAFVNNSTAQVYMPGECEAAEKAMKKARGEHNG